MAISNGDIMRSPGETHLLKLLIVTSKLAYIDAMKIEQRIILRKLKK